MNENKNYLSEEEYQRINKKVKTTGKVLLIVGALIMAIAIGLIIYGMVSDTKAGFTAFGIGGFLNVIGFAILGFGLMATFTGNRREIMAYQAQQVMPVAQEGAEKMAPTAGVVAKEIAKGVKEGINEADAENKSE